MFDHFTQNILVNELEEDWFKCLKMRKLNDIEKFTAQVLFKFTVSQDTFIQIAFSRT